ncbi:MAG: DUF4331 family protein [Kofleriaceae bacterium]
MNKFLISSLAFGTLAAIGCGGDDGATPTPDAAVDAPPAGTLCETYCANMDANCTGDNAQYLNTADCMSFCAEAGWPDGAPGAMAGNSLECRVYHSGAPAASNGALHCPHAGPTGDGVCGTVDFRTDAPTAYTRVDAMGMPAVSTALVGSTMKNAYNDASPDSSGFVSEFVTNLTGVHAALDDDLTGLGLTPCAAGSTCVSQEVAPGVSVASLIVPSDSLNVNPAAAAGFPNGRKLSDPVIDVTLAVILLRLGMPCGAGTCTPATLASLPLNPPANDVAFSTAFPYVAPIHAP